MSNRLVLGAVLLACAFAARAEETFYQIDLVPTGKIISRDAPTSKGTTILFHKYPDGTLISMRKSDVKNVTKISAQTATATNPAERVISIGNLAMQGGSAQAGPTNVSAVAGSRGGPELGKGFYANVVPGITQGMPNSLNDYRVGRTFAAPPGNASQSAPGAPPTNPVANTGGNPPTMPPR
ncbi:MAG TPA: hypothetical protein VGL03_11290 [Thermoanaerobaculia bacterium]|jgi:hypothetical protein